MAKHHGMMPLSGQSAYCWRGHTQTRSDRFGRMFDHLPSSYVPSDILADIGRQGGPMDGGANKSRTSTVPVGQVIFGQFIDHDITLDVMSRFDRVNVPGRITNQRTPALDLDCIYGSGPEPHPYFYHNTGTFAGAKLLTGADEPSADANASEDLFRAPAIPGGGRGRAIIGDPRNDENRVISQMQLGMIRFHNKVCDDLHAATGHSGAELFEEARREVTWHYQWAVVNDFLVHMCGKPVVNDILACGRKYYCGDEPYIPVEFSVAAYRFGHSMVPMKINIRKGGGTHEFFGEKLGRGFDPVTTPDAVVQWAELLETGSTANIQKAEKLDTKLATDLLALPFVTPPDEASLATRNLLRGNSFLLPGGDKVAIHMERPASEIDKVMTKIGTMSGNRITDGAPLWLYILAEAEVIGRETSAGSFDKSEGLGPVGARIVAEVIIGLLELDPTSYLGMNRNWGPTPAYGSLGKILASV
jgi:hypothetical protein